MTAPLPAGNGRVAKRAPTALTPVKYLKFGTRLLEPHVYITPYQGRPVVVKDYRRYQGTPLALAARLLVWRETRILRALSDWSHAPTLLGSAGLLLGLELVSGVPLSEISPESCPPLLRQLGGMVARLHASGVLHNDLHASNLLVSAGTLVLLDYASAIRLPRWALRLPVVRELRRADLGNVLRIRRRLGDNAAAGARARVIARRGWVDAIQHNWKRWYAWAKS